jgi:tripartite-type tricarboxylate transporter receptor subunit TctC
MNPIQINMTHFKQRLLRSIPALAVVLTSFSALAQAQQLKPLRIVVPYAAGGPIDLTVRILAEAVKAELGTIVVENRPGAGGNIGADVIAKAAPDGTTIGIAAVATHAINPWLFKKMPYNALTDFSPITLMVRVPNVLVMNADTAKRLNIKSLADLVQYAKTNPGKLNYGSGGNGSAGHLAGELFKSRASIFAVHIPYNGGAPAQQALLAGSVDFNIDNLATASANIKAGKLLALAVTSSSRNEALPDVPTLNASYMGLEIDTWWGLVAPKNTTIDTINTLNKVFTQVLNQASVKERYAKMFAQAVSTSPAVFTQVIVSEHARYETVVKRSGASVD